MARSPSAAEGDTGERRPLLSGDSAARYGSGGSAAEREWHERRERRSSMNSVHSDYERGRRESHTSVGRSSFGSQSSVSAWISEHAAEDMHQTEADTARILGRNWAASDVHVRTALLARVSSRARLAEAPGAVAHRLGQADNKMARVRRRIVSVLESNCCQMTMITLILVEMLAVIFELLLEIGFLSFNEKIDQPLINVLHYVSVSILSLFVLEFAVYFFALGFKFCCRAWLLIDVVIVTVALITELYMHHRPNPDRGGDPDEEESEVITKEIIFVVTLRIIRIVHSLFTQFQRHEDRIAVRYTARFCNHARPLAHVELWSGASRSQQKLASPPVVLVWSGSARSRIWRR